MSLLSAAVYGSTTPGDWDDRNSFTAIEQVFKAVMFTAYRPLDEGAPSAERTFFGPSEPSGDAPTDPLAARTEEQSSLSAFQVVLAALLRIPAAPRACTVLALQRFLEEGVLSPPAPPPPSSRGPPASYDPSSPPPPRAFAETSCHLWRARALLLRFPRGERQPPTRASRSREHGSTTLPSSWCRIISGKTSYVLPIPGLEAEVTFAETSCHLWRAHASLLRFPRDERQPLTRASRSREHGSTTLPQFVVSHYIWKNLIRPGDPSLGGQRRLRRYVMRPLASTRSGTSGSSR
jgi:hypothetical protein